MKKIKKELFTGETGCRLADFWFKFIGYLAGISALTLASETIEDIYLSGAVAFSYFVLFLWLKAKSDNFIWWLMPSGRPQLEERSPIFSKKIGFAILGGGISGYVTIGAYFFAQEIVQQLVSKAA